MDEAKTLDPAGGDGAPDVVDMGDVASARRQRVAAQESRERIRQRMLDQRMRLLPDATAMVLKTLTRLRSAEFGHDRAARDLDVALGALAQVEHRLKTSATLVAGWVLTLEHQLRELHPQERFDGLETIHRRAERLIEDLSALISVAAHGRLPAPLRLGPVELDPLLEQAARELDRLSIAHEVRVEGERGARVTADRGALVEVLEHLVENAVKYSPDGGEIILRVAVTDGTAAIEVCDEGIGLPDGVDVFAPRQRGPGADATSTGMGLAVVETLVGAMDGNVHAHRNPGRGTTFVVELAAVEEPGPVTGSHALP